jgi:CDP-glycerol glycerophosphotransferase (TagB/SpsB family)
MISPNDITCIVVIENYNELADHTIESIKKFTNPIPKILICFNTGNTKAINIKRYKRDKINFIEKCSNDKNIKIVMNDIPGNIKNTSIRHGIGINKLMELVDTKYTAIIESDVILTSDKWYYLDERKFDIKAIPRGRKIFHIGMFAFSYLKQIYLKTWIGAQKSERGMETPDGRCIVK